MIRNLIKIVQFNFIIKFYIFNYNFSFVNLFITYLMMEYDSQYIKFLEN